MSAFSAKRAAICTFRNTTKPISDGRRHRIACTIPQGEDNMLPHFTWEFHFIYHLFAVQNSARFHASAKKHTFCYQFSTITPPLQSNIKFRATAARSAGIQKGRSPFAHGGVRGIEECKHSSGKVFDFSTLIKFEAAFPFLRSKKTVCGGTNGVYIAIVSQSFVQ